MYHVNDVVPTSVMSDDIDDEGVFNPNVTTINKANNYSYDGIGNLVRDSIAGIALIDWTAYGKIKSITHRPGFMQIVNGDTTYPPDLCFNYDAQGNRISKIVKPRTAMGLKAPSYYTSTYYVRDAQGNVQSVYTKHDSTEISTLYFKQTEKHIYGSNHIGIDETQKQLLGLTPNADTSNHYLGKKVYELTNHLDNILTTVSDKKMQVNPQSPIYVYCSPDAGQMSIDSIGGMKIQPRIQFGGVAFPFKTISGQTYNVRFYFRQGNTNTDSVSGDQPVASIQNSTGAYTYINLPTTGSYVMNYPSVDTIAYFKPQYYLTGSTPNHYFYIDSLQITQAGSTADTIVAYTSDISSVAFTSGFGAPLQGMTWSAGSDPLAFNGKRKDDEVYGSGNLYDYGARMYDSRLGRFLSTDPYFKKFAYYTPYQYAGNKPIECVDLDGLEEINKQVLNVDKEGWATVTIQVKEGTSSLSNGGALLIHNQSGTSTRTKSNALNQVLGINNPNSVGGNPNIIPLLGGGQGAVSTAGGGIDAPKYNLKFKQSDLAQTGVQILENPKKETQTPTMNEGKYFTLLVPPDPAPGGKSSEHLPIDSKENDLVSIITNHVSKAVSQTQQSDNQIKSILITYPEGGGFGNAANKVSEQLRKQYPNAEIKTQTTDENTTGSLRGNVSVDAVGSPQQNLKKGE